MSSSWAKGLIWTCSQLDLSVLRGVNLNSFVSSQRLYILFTTPRITPIASARQYTSVPVQVETCKLLVSNRQVQKYGRQKPHLLVHSSPQHPWK